MMLAEALYLSSSSSHYAESWNFGPDEENVKSVSWLADYIIDCWKSPIQWNLDRADFPYEADYLKLDSSKAKQHLGWRPRWSIEKCLNQTIAWYQAYQRKEDMYKKTLCQINDFMHESIDTQDLTVKMK